MEGDEIVAINGIPVSRSDSLSYLIHAQIEQPVDLTLIRGDDTTSTTPASLEFGLRAFDRPIILIAGGASKNLPLKKIATTTVQKAKKIILIKGSGTEEFKKMIIKFGGKEQIVGLFDNLKQ